MPILATQGKGVAVMFGEGDLVVAQLQEYGGGYVGIGIGPIPKPLEIGKPVPPEDMAMAQPAVALHFKSIDSIDVVRRALDVAQKRLLAKGN